MLAGAQGTGRRRSNVAAEARVRRDCDEEDGCDAFIQSPPAPLQVKGLCDPKSFNRGSFTWPGQLAGRAIFSPPPKTMAVEDAPQAALNRPGHGGLVRAGIGGGFPAAIVFSM